MQGDLERWSRLDVLHNNVGMSGPDSAIERLRGVPVGRRVFIHVNNTNPALLADSPERAELERAGWEVAHDGMELSL